MIFLQLIVAAGLGNNFPDILGALHCVHCLEELQRPQENNSFRL